MADNGNAPSDAQATGYVALPGSARQPIPGAQHIGALDPNETVEISVYLRPRSGDNFGAAGSLVSGQHPPMTREEFAASHGADPADIARVEAFAREHGLSVVETDAARRVVVLTGTVAAMSAAFNVTLQRYQHNGQVYRGRSGEVMIPAELAPIVTGVFGLDDRPQASTHVRIYELAPVGSARPRAAGVSYTPPQVAALYDYPTNGNGSGQAIALIELGGGYNTSDLTTYFQQIGVAMPTVKSVSVDGGSNSPTGDPNSADGEVALDIEVAGAVAPGATIVVYFAPNTDRGFIDAVTQAIHDTTNKPSVLSISWGSAESNWTTQARQQMDQAFQAGAMLGVTVCAAAGDSGASDGVSDGLAHVDFPASSTYALGCGGTRLDSSGGTVTSETVWNDGNGSAGGGGISDIFALPPWQANAHVPPSVNPGGHVGRGVPDVAGDADPATGYSILVDGQSGTFGGTSAVAPLWAGLVALLNQQLSQPVGYLNPTLYQQVAGSGGLRDITSGNNDTVTTSSGNTTGYQASAGWDACTGLGSPDGAKLLDTLKSLAGSQSVPAPASAPAPEPAPTRRRGARSIITAFLRPRSAL